MMLWAHSDTLPLTTVHDYLDNFFIQAMSQVPGVAQARSSATRSPSIRIQVDPAKLASIGLTLEEVRTSARQRHHQRRQGHHLHAQGRLHHRGQRPDHRRRAVQRRHPRLSRRRLRCACATSARRSLEAHQPLRRRLPEQQARHPAGRLQAARRQRHRHRRADQGAAAASSPPTFRRR